MGDLDICVIVEDEEFGRASRVLAERLTIHQPENWSPTLASDELKRRHQADGRDAYRAAKERLIGAAR